MGDVENRYAATRELANTREQPPHRVPLQGGRRLVEQHALRPAPERARDLHDLTLLDREVSAERLGLDVVAPVAHDVARLRAHVAPAHESVGGAEKHVLSDRQLRHDHGVLVHRRYPLAPPGDVADSRRRPASKADDTGVGRLNSGQDRHDSRFAGAVAANEPQALPGAQVQVNAAQRDACRQSACRRRSSRPAPAAVSSWHIPSSKGGGGRHQDGAGHRRLGRRRANAAVGSAVDVAPQR